MFKNTEEIKGMTNEDIYRTEINACLPDYKISIYEWLNEIVEENILNNLIRELNQIEDIAGMYFVAVDFSIPLIMVKWLLNNLD